MKRLLLGVLAAACVLAALWAEPAAAASGTASDRKVVFTFDRKFMPFSYVSNGRPTGFEVEILEAVLEDTGLGIDYKPSRDWNRAQADLSGGIAQVASGMTRTDLRQQLFLFPDTPTMTLDLRFFVNRVSGYKGVSELRGATVAAVRDSLYQRLLQEFGGVRISLFDSGEDALQAVVSGDAQAYFGAEKVARDIISRKGLKNLLALGPIVRSVPVYFALYKGEKNLVEIINHGLKRLIADGEYDKIYRKWFVPELSTERMKKLVSEAAAALPLAYAPHSGRPEAAAVFTRRGEVHVGASMDNQAGRGLSALEAAVAEAVRDGDLEVYAAVRVDAKGRVLPPTARERELLWEFGRQVLVVMEIDKGAYEAWSLSRLLPLADGVPGRVD